MYSESFWPVGPTEWLLGVHRLSELTDELRLRALFPTLAIHTLDHMVGTAGVGGERQSSSATFPPAANSNYSRTSQVSP